MGTARVSPVSDRKLLRQRRSVDFSAERGNGRTVSLVELFSGCGGMTLGFCMAAREFGFGVALPLAMDVDRKALSIHAANFPHARVMDTPVEQVFDGHGPLTNGERRIRRLVDAVDILAGGPPCQGHSDLNNHTRRRDSRNSLYLLMARAAAVLRPSVVIIENVPAVVHAHGGVVEETAASLELLDYEVVHGIVHLQDLGVPQRRKRHVLVATRLPGFHAVGCLEELQTDRPSDRTVRWAIEDLCGGAGEPGVGFDSPGAQSPANRQRIRWLFDRDAYTLANSERPPCHRDRPHTYKSVYGRMRWDEAAPTITTGFGSMGQGCYVHPAEHRTITPHEAARIQTFPDSFRFCATQHRSAWARAIGNAVPPFLTRALGRQILREFS